MSAINIRNMPDDIHLAAKIAALKEGVSLRDWVIEAIKEKLERINEAK